MSPRLKIRAWVTLCALLLAGGAEFMLMAALQALLSAIAGAEGANEAHAIAFFAAGAAAVAVTRLVSFFLTDRLAIEYSAFASIAIFGRAMHRSYSEYRNARSAELFAALENSQRLLNGTLTPLLQAIVSAVVALILMTYLLRLAPMIVLPMILFGFTIYVVSGFATGGRLRHGSHSLQRLAVQRLEVAHAAQRGFRDLILGQGVQGAVASFVALEGRYRAEQVRSRLTAILPRHATELLVASLLVALTLYGANLPGGIMPHIPLFGVVALGIQRLLPLWSGFYAGWSNFQSNSAFLAQSLDAMSGPQTQAGARAEAVPFTSRIVFEDVRLRYVDRVPVLDGVQLTIPRGARIGIIGASGSGKSSLLDVLAGLVAPSEGRILIDGLPLDSEERRRGWQCQIACVGQSSYLPDTNLQTAIAGEGSPPDPDRLARAVKGASLEAFVASLPDGLTTRIGEAGILMSEGQKQRVAIARALYRGAALLVLDEITSNLDEVTEQAVVDTLAGFNHELTIVMATHRTGPLAVCDQVYTLENGRLRPMEIRP